MQFSSLKNITITYENIDQFSDILNLAPHPSDIAEIIENKPSEERLILFKALKPPQNSAVFEHLSLRTQNEMIVSLPSKEIADLINAISVDDRTALLQQLPHDLVHQLLKYLPPKERDFSIKLLGYREDSVGRLMTPDYIAIKMSWSVQEVLDYIREHGHDSETVNVIYAVDDQGVLVDDFRIRQFLFAPLQKKVEEIADRKFIALKPNDDQESAIQVFRKYGRVALPVVDSKGIMLGIVTMDDILHTALESDTEDIQKLAGIEALRAPYMRVPFLELMKKRGGWLVILFLGEILTASAMGFFENEIAKAVVLALFLPLIISSGGNSGSQASTLIIRALVLNEVKLKDWFRIFRRELFSGLFLGTLLGFIGFLRISLWGSFSQIYGEHFILLAMTVFIAIIGVVLWGTLMGAMLPLLIKRIGFDPAASSAPFVATLVDVTGIIIYFLIASLILKGTLL